jgi:N-acetylmuramic acid 6-phosphate etherase
MLPFSSGVRMSGPITEAMRDHAPVLVEPVAATEAVDPSYTGIDMWEDAAILSALLDGQRRAVAAVEAAIPALAQAARIGAACISAGGRLVYVGAGSPALIAIGDALELPGTYGLRREQIVLIFAGLDAITQTLTGIDEDDAEQARRRVAEAGIGERDFVVAVSASGSTPFTVAGLAAARAAGAASVGIAGNPGVPLFEAADVAVLLQTGAEVISGSTRMGAGSAQKAALNMLSTLIAVRLGHVHDGQMVNVKADNDKLRQRAARIVGRVARVDDIAALRALKLSEGEVKPAILIAAGAETLAAAEALLGQTRGNVRTALARLAVAAPALN